MAFTFKLSLQRCIKKSIANPQMASSSTRRLQNDVILYEDSSDRKILSNLYYVVRIILTSRDSQSQTEKILDVAKLLAKNLSRSKFGNDGKPLAVYCYDAEVYLLFSSLDGTTEHNLKGSHHGICSFYASLVARENPKLEVVCSIVEMDSRTKVLIYFQTKIHENVKRTVVALSNDKLNRKDIEHLTLNETLDVLAKKAGANAWNDAPPVTKFGIFYKSVVTSEGKEKFSILSEKIDLGTMEKCAGYLFDA